MQLRSHTRYLDLVKIKRSKSHSHQQADEFTYLNLVWGNSDLQGGTARAVGIVADPSKKKYIIKKAMSTPPKPLIDSKPAKVVYNLRDIETTSG